MLVIVMVVIVAINVPSEPQSASGDRAGRTSRPGRNQGGAISRLSLGEGGVSGWQIFENLLGSIS